MSRNGITKVSKSRQHRPQKAFRQSNTKAGTKPAKASGSTLTQDPEGLKEKMREKFGRNAAMAFPLSHISSLYSGGLIYGPRKSGKTSLAKIMWPVAQYIDCAVKSMHMSKEKNVILDNFQEVRKIEEFLDMKAKNQHIKFLCVTRSRAKAIRKYFPSVLCPIVTLYPLLANMPSDIADRITTICKNNIAMAVEIKQRLPRNPSLGDLNLILFKMGLNGSGWSILERKYKSIVDLHQPISLKDISRKMGISKEEVEQLESYAPFSVCVSKRGRHNFPIIKEPELF